MSHSKKEAPYTLCMPLFLKQRSDMSHSEEQARYALCMPRSLSKGLT